MTDQLPPDVEKAYTADGRPYYINHADGTTSWTPPAVVMPIPPAYDAIEAKLMNANNPNHNYNNDSSPPPAPPTPPSAPSASKPKRNNGAKQLLAKSPALGIYFVVVGAMVFISMITLLIIFFTGPNYDMPKPPLVITVTGNVTDAATGRPIASVLISAGNSSTYSDGSGFYAIDFEPSISTRTIPPTDINPSSITHTFTMINATIDGYVPQLVYVPIKDNTKYSRPILMNPFSVSLPFNLRTGFSRNFDNGYNGTGVVKLVGQSSASTTPTYTFRFAVIPPRGGPGVLEANRVGVRSQTTTLQSAGMFYWDVRDSAGDPTTLPSQSIIQIGSGNVSYTEEVDARTTDESNFWEFNPSSGVWGNPVPVESTVVDGRRRLDAFESLAQARRAGYWNNDRLVRTSCIVGTMVESVTNTKCVGAYIQGGKDLFGNGMFSTDTTSSQGEFCLEGSSIIEMYGMGERGLTSLGTEFGNEGQCGSQLCEQVGVVKVSEEVCGYAAPPVQCGK